MYCCCFVFSFPFLFFPFLISLFQVLLSFHSLWRRSYHCWTFSLLPVAALLSLLSHLLCLAFFPVLFLLFFTFDFVLNPVAAVYYLFLFFFAFQAFSHISFFLCPYFFFLHVFTLSAPSHLKTGLLFPFPFHSFPSHPFPNFLSLPSSFLLFSPLCPLSLPYYSSLSLPFPFTPLLSFLSLFVFSPFVPLLPPFSTSSHPYLVLCFPSLFPCSFPSALNFPFNPPLPSLSSSP